MFRRAALLLSVVVLLGACQEEQLVGACVMESLEPVLTLTEVTVAGRAASSVRIDAVRRDRFREDAVGVMSGEHVGLTRATGGAVHCAVPCGFGESRGEWSFRVRARGAAAERVQVYAEYALSDGGCPGYYDDGTEVEVSLKPSRPAR